MATSQIRPSQSAMLGGDEVLSAPPISWFHDDDLAAAAPSSDDEEDERQEEEKEEKDGDDNSCCCNSPEDEAIAAEIQRRHDARQDTFQQQQQLKQHESKYEIQQSDRVVRNNSNGSTRNQTTNTTTTTTTTTLEQQQYHPKKTPPLASFRLNPPLSSTSRVAPSPSWKEMGQYVLPSAAKELLSSSLRRVCYTARLSYAMGRWHRKYSDLGNNSGGFFRPNLSPNLNQQLQQRVVELPAVSNLPWVDRQMVREWRTYLPQDNIATDNKHNKHNNNGTKRVDDDEDIDFDRARTLVPQPLQRPRWQKADLCHECYKPFGPTRLRHHCRLCGYSYCQLHSGSVHTLPQLGYDPEVPERVCDPCKRACLLQNLAERVAWRLARCRDLQEGQLTPYFETGIDTMEQAALRIAHAALATARSIPLGAQAHVAVETVEVLRRHGLNGIYGIMLRKEFLAAADLLRKALGINKTAWPLSVHELSAAIFYALAQHRAMRGINPDREEIIHTLINDNDDNGNSMSTTASSRQSANENIVIDETDEYNPDVEHLVSLVKTVAEPLDCAIPNTKLLKDTMTCSSTAGLPFTPVCTPVPDHVLNSLIFYAPIALTFIYATKEVDMQLLAAQQGWKLLYACLNPDKERDGGMVSDIPASAVFVHEQQKTACLAIRGTATIHDVVTDLRQVPVPFPEVESGGCEGWTNVTDSKGLAVCGMASAALNLFREHIDVLLHLVREGYKIRITGHSLGGGVATLIGVLILKELEDVMALEKFKPIKLPELLRVYAYGPPSSVDAPLAEFTESFVTTAVLHDDVVPRLTPTSCRGLLKHLLHIRETWVKAHLEDDLLAIGERASLAWAPRWRSGFTLTSASKVSLRRSSRLIKRVGKKMIKSGTKQIVSVAMAAAASAQQQASGSGLSPKDDKQKADKQEEAAKNKKIDSGVHVDDPAFSPIHDHFSVPRASVSQGPAATHDTAEDTNGTNDQEKEPKLLVEIMGGLDSRSNAVIIDGEEFFEADENLIETEEDSLATTEMFADAFDEARSHELVPVVTPTTPATTMNTVCDSQQPAFEDKKKEGPNADKTFKEETAEDDDDGPGAVVLEETPLPRMFIPGKVVHIYSHRGVFKATYVPRAFRELRRISMAGNMLSDHTTQAYHEALLETRSVRHAQERPPRWTSFDEDDTCSCCASRFTWASTSDSAAQEARDKHNCRSCGTLVCNPCSTNRIPLPSVGLTVAVRVCDRCYNDLGGGFPTHSFSEEMRNNSDGQCSNQVTTGSDKPERQRERRSTVVDDLARRIKESALAGG